MTLVGRFREKTILNLAQERRELYERLTQPEQRHTAVLERLNAVWANAIVNVPRYRQLADQNKVPKAFSSLVQFAATVPPLTKAETRNINPDLQDQRRPAERIYKTGGSTGSPTISHGWNKEIEVDNINRWIGRSFYGIGPSDPCFLVWGHHHLLGKGMKSRIQSKILASKDRLQARTRFNAYNLSEDRARQAGDLILRRRPRYLLGYSSALDLIARINQDRAEEFAALNLKASIACAESYPRPDSPDVISRTFGCPAAMEYGAVETHVTAYTIPAGGYQVFWLNHLFELGEPGPGGGRVLRITCLYERKTPLIRYEIGDEVMPIESEPAIAPARIQSILGRVNSIIKLADGRAVHTTAISRAISDRRDVNRFQIVDRNPGLALRIVPASPEAREVIEQHVRANLIRISPTLRDAPILFVDQIEQSIAGKTPLVVRDDTPLS